MFERRLRTLLLLLGVPVLLLILRLVQLQVVSASQFRAEAERLLLRDVVYLPCLRGEITGHDGQTRLAYDAPSWNISVHYRLLVDEEEYLRKPIATRYRGMDSESARLALKRDIDASWQVISQLSGQSRAELRAVCDRILQRVAAEKRDVEKRAIRSRRAVPRSITSETIPHPIVRGLDQQQQAIARERLRDFEWVTVVSDQRRLYAGGPAFGHLLGRLGQVDIDDVSGDAYAGVPLGELYAYESGDLKGVSGLEWLGERWLRGRRGRERRDIEGHLVNDPPRADPLDGKPMRLTIDVPLQQKVYEILRNAVSGEQDGVRVNPYSTGGAAVILDVPSREVLAIVSYPSYDPNATPQELQALAEDELGRPLECRTLRMRYPPGSTVKPMLLAAAVTEGKVTPETTFLCEGRLFAEEEGWRCENHLRGMVDPLFAIQHSCNVFFYHVGQDLTTPVVAWYMSQFGLGRDSGTGFPQEADGMLPRTHSNGIARLAGIGQAEVDATPIQVANMMATIASGVYRPATLWVDDPRPRPAQAPRSPAGRPITDQAWRMAREGMFRAVNVKGGTGFENARLTDAGDYILLGKTGTAEGSRRIQRYYTIHLPDGSTKEDVGYSRSEVQRRYRGANVVAQERIANSYPPPEFNPTHAWFAGYLTTRQRYLEPTSGGRMNVAIAVLIEYAGHGGEAAAPVALEMIRAVLERAGELPEGQAVSTQQVVSEDSP